MVHCIRPFSTISSLFFGALLFNFSATFCQTTQEDSLQDTTAKQTTRLLLIRHGKTDWNCVNKIQGHSDIPLNEQGKAQAQKVAQLLHQDGEPIDAIYSSDLMRAYWTAHEIATLYKHPITQIPELRERFMGDAEGMDEHDFVDLYGEALIELEATISDRWQRWHHDPVPGAETKADLITRTEKILRDVAQAHPGKTIALVTHGAVIKILIMHLSNFTQHTPNCCVAEIHYTTVDDTLSFVGMRKINS